MNAYSNHSKAGRTARVALKIFSILAILLAGLLTVGTQRVQADPPVCDATNICASVIQERPDQFDPQLVVVTKTHAYTGPGYTYTNYGDLAEGFTSPVTGISEDGKWLIIPLPLSIAADGQAWVNLEDVSAKNIQVLPEWLASCDPSGMTYCGYIRAHTAPSDLAIPTWLAHCDRSGMTYCSYILANSPQYVPVKQPSFQAMKFGMVH